MDFYTVSISLSNKRLSFKVIQTSPHSIDEPLNYQQKKHKIP